MPPRKTPSKGSKPDKKMRDALMLALHREVDDPNGGKTKKLNLVATKLVDLAIQGDVQAIKEINDRVDGKVTQPIGGDEETPLRMIGRIELVPAEDGNSAG